MAQAKLIDPPTILNASSKCTLNLFHLNMRSISKKHDDLDLLENCGVGLQTIMLTETWYTNECSFFAYRDFRNVTLNRTSKCSGGVFMIISPSLKVTVIKEYTCSTPDYEFLTLQNECNIFRVAYCPQQGDVNLFSFHRFLDFVKINKLTRWWF